MTPHIYKIHYRAKKTNYFPGFVVTANFQVNEKDHSPITSDFAARDFFRSLFHICVKLNFSTTPSSNRLLNKAVIKAAKKICAG